MCMLIITMCNPNSKLDLAKEAKAAHAVFSSNGVDLKEIFVSCLLPFCRYQYCWMELSSVRPVAVSSSVRLQQRLPSSQSKAVPHYFPLSIESQLQKEFCIFLVL